MLYQSNATGYCLSVARWLCVATAFAVAISVTATSILFVLSFLMACLYVLFACLSNSTGKANALWQGIKQRRALLACWVLFALYVLGTFYSISDGHERWRDLQKMHWLLMAPILAFLFNEPSWRRRLQNSFLLANTLILILSYAKALGWLGWVNWLGVDLASGNNVFFEHIVQTFFMDIALFIAGYRLLFEAHTLSKKMNYAYLTLLLFGVFNLFFMEESATGFLAFFVLMTYLFYQRFSFKGLLYAGFFLVFLMGLSLSQSTIIKNRLVGVKNDYIQYQSGQSISSLGLRLAMAKTSVDLIKQQTWYGYGTGGIKAAMLTKLSKDQIARTGLMDYVEISPFNFILQFGLLGLMGFIIFLRWQFAGIKCLPRQEALLMQGFLLAYLSASLINCFFISFCETHLYALMMAMCYGAHHAESQAES